MPRSRWRRQLPTSTALAALLAAPAVRPVAGGGLFAGSPTVVELTTSRFRSTVLTSRTAWFIDFYADWCPHCQQFAPVWEEMAGKFRGDGRVSFGGVDCAVEADFCGDAQVGAYPTLRGYNLPGLDNSSTARGGSMGEPGYSSDEHDDVLKLLQKMLLALGPAPVINGTGDALSPALSPKVPAPAPAPSDEVASAPSAASRLIDAEVALVYALRQGTAVAAARTPAGDPEDPLALTDEALKELVLWLSFLAEVLPSEVARADVGALANTARAAQLGSGVLPRAAWLEALDRRKVDVVVPEAGKDPAPYWHLCGTYTCGLWTLFHIVLASVANGPGGRRLEEATQVGPTPGEAAIRIRGFVKTFFGCEACVEHFLGMFDSCKFGRCELSPRDGPGTALWLWQVHNNVSARIAGEQGRPVPEPWPKKAFCEDCWVQDPSNPGTHWDPNAVFRYLSLAYLPQEESRGPGSKGPFQGLASLNLPAGLITPATTFIVAVAVAAFAWCSFRRDGKCDLERLCSHSDDTEEPLQRQLSPHSEASLGSCSE